MGYVPVVPDQNMSGTAGHSMQYPSPQDLTDFMEEFRSRWGRCDLHYRTD